MIPDELHRFSTTYMISKGFETRIYEGESTISKELIASQAVVLVSVFLLRDMA